MIIRPTVCALIPLGMLLGCGSEPDVASAPPPVVAGLYEVEGTTTVIESGDTRGIQGSVILSEEEGAYTATFHLATQMPAADGTLEAEVVGKGQGQIEGNTLKGTAETQLLTAMVPGARAQFPFLPQVYGPRLVSSSVATVEEDGSIRIEIENRGAEGEEYAPTRTVLRGQRVSPAGEGAEIDPAPEP